MDPPHTSDAPERSLVPHEHGAYGQIALPIVTGLSLGRPTASALMLGLGALAGFMAYEPLLVLTGRRGARARDRHGRRAWRVAGIWLGLAVLLGGCGFAIAPLHARVGSLVPPLMAVAVAALVHRGWERTTVGEAFVAAALSSAGLPVALAAGAPIRAVSTAWAAWVLGFACATVAVEVVMARARRSRIDPGRMGAAVVLALAGAAVAAFVAGRATSALPLGVAPLALVSLLVILGGPTPRRLKRVGWTALAASLATAAILVASLR
jgi:hypothetical protein